MYLLPTMRYMMRQKIFASDDYFIIKDEGGHDAFIADGRAFNIGSKLSFQDLSGNELLSGRRKLFCWRGPNYEISQNGRRVAVVKREQVGLFRCKFRVDAAGPEDLEAAGSFREYNYKFTRGHKVVAEVSKRWFPVRDTYGVDIEEGENPVLILASAVVIDMVCVNYRVSGRLSDLKA